MKSGSLILNNLNESRSNISSNIDLQMQSRGSHLRHSKASVSASNLGNSNSKIPAVLGDSTAAVATKQKMKVFIVQQIAFLSFYSISGKVMNNLMRKNRNNY